MKKLMKLALTATMVAGLFGAASADHHMKDTPNQKQAGGSWYYPYIGPTTSDFGGPMMGFRYDKDYSGEVVYQDKQTLIVEADGSGDLMTFTVFPGTTRFDPSTDGVRVGSKVEVSADHGMKAKMVHAVPFYKWLAAQTK